MQHFYGITAVKVLHTILKHKMTGYKMILKQPLNAVVWYFGLYIQATTSGLCVTACVAGYSCVCVSFCAEPGT